MKEEIYPIVIKINKKEVMIGSAKVEIDGGSLINSSEQEHRVILKETKIQFGKGDFLTKVRSIWNGFS